MKNLYNILKPQQTIRLLADFNPLLHELLNDSTKHIKYLSWKVQNELIDILSENLCHIICEEIISCSFFSIILDSTQDITKIDQVSVIIRYVIVDYETHTINIKESFLGFYALEQHGSMDYAHLIQNVLHKHNIKIKNCIGQGYDGASVMSGQYSGVQKRINNIVPTALFVHCCAHNLNLVISDASKISPSISRHFETLHSVLNFFNSNGPIWASLALGDNTASKIRRRVLKKVCSTRWEFRHTAVFVLKERFIDVIKCLTIMSLTSGKKDERDMSKALKNKIESSEFVLILFIWENILRYLNTVSKILQSTNISLENASMLLDKTIQNMQHLQNYYSTIYLESKRLCDKWRIDISFHSSRSKFCKRVFGEVDGDRRFDISKDIFRIK
ncbi:Ribonuclease H-like domain,Domain of unknown function DUF4371, partial [Cinara cedri]